LITVICQGLKFTLAPRLAFYTFIISSFFFSWC